jgi:hypothetical protein
MLVTDATGLKFYCQSTKALYHICGAGWDELVGIQCHRILRAAATIILPLKAIMDIAVT